MDDILEELKLIESCMRGKVFVITDNTFLSAFDTETWIPKLGLLFTSRRVITSIS